MKSIVKTRSLSKKYGKIYRVKDIDLDIGQGEVYGFLGPNGAGKSTTLKMLLGLVKPTSGDVFIFSKKMNQKNRLQILHHTGSLIESPSYYGHLTAEENLQIIQKLINVPSENIDKVLKIVRLIKQKNKKVDHYSLGMKQRLGIATAMLGFPKLLILDEPTNGLDPAGIQEMRELIISLPKKYGMTVIVSSHLLSEIDQIATMVGIIKEGKLIFQNNLKELHRKSNQYIALRTHNNTMAKQILSKKGIRIINRNNNLIIPNCQDEMIAACNRLLVNSDVDVIRIEEHKKSLEDIFLELTGVEVSL